LEQTELVLIDTRRLATEHLGILNVPKYFSRLMQTIEPALDQLIRIGVLGTYHVVSAADWSIALHRHSSYVPERKALLAEGGANSPELTRVFCARALERAGLTPEAAAEYAAAATTEEQVWALRRLTEVIEAMKQEGVLPQIALQTLRRVLELGATSSEGRDYLDWCEIAVEVCAQKKRSGQKLRNSAGLLMKIVKDPAARGRLVSEDLAATLLERFRQRERAALRQREENEKRAEVLEYEQYCRAAAQELFAEMTASARQAARKEKAEALRQQDRFERLSSEMREAEIDELIVQELARKEVPSFEKWLLRKRARQTVLPFLALEHPAPAQEAESG
jgi:hypothetical protein